MKNLVFYSLLAAGLVAAASCQKNIRPDSESSEPCSLNVHFDNIPTRVSGLPAANEKNIKDVQIFVFNSRTQKLDAAVRESGMNVSSGSYTMSTKLNCTRGQRQVWAVVNAPVNYVDGNEADRVSSVEQLRSLTTRLTDNKPDALVMVGAVAEDFDEAEESVVVPVERICAAVVIESITNDMLVPAYQRPGMVKITGAYLMNVPSLQKLDKSLSAGSLPKTDWISANVKSGDSVQLSLTADRYSSNVLDYGKKWENVSTFYSYPNDCTADPKEVWSPSKSVLVVEAEVDGQACIYPVRLGTLMSNHKYMVNLTIRHMGCDPSEPWKKIEFTDMTASINVIDWETGTPSINETI